jgi:hypothetical protein
MATPLGIERFLNVRAAVGPTFSRDGRFVAFLTNPCGCGPAPACVSAPHNSFPDGASDAETNFLSLNTDLSEL